jgi:hypothetical protein
VAVSDKGMNEQINPSQQAERTMPFVLMIARESQVNAVLGRQIGHGRYNGLDSPGAQIRLFAESVQILISRLARANHAMYGSPIPTSMALNYIGNLLRGHAMLAKYFLQVFGHLDRIIEREPITFVIPIVINAMFDD